MMPSACTKPDQKPSPEVETPLKKCRDIVDKKVRNLEKKKGKLDSYREKAKDDLNDDQRAAIENYETVLQTLDFARDLQKQFNQVGAETDKQDKKAARRAKLEKQQQEVNRIRELLQLQNLLDSMGAENVRSDFLSGKNGAAELQEANLKQLDDFYKLISPSREGESSYESQLSSASEHIANYLDVKEKEVAGTTYKDLRGIVDRISGCSYFDGAKKEVEEEVPEVVDEEEAPVTAASSETSVTPVAAEVAEADEEPVAVPKEEDSNTQAFENAQSEYYASDNGQFSRQPRPFQEIVSSVQGSFNFLQDSEIEVDAGSVAHIDPAVVAAHPIVTDPTYQNAGMISNPSDPTSYSQQALVQDPAQADHSADSQSQYLDQSAATTSQTGFDASAYTTEQGFNPNLISQSLVSTTTPHVFVEQPSSLAVQMSMGGAAVPQPIPMPTQGLQGDAYNPQAAPESSQTFTMNPNANVFRSIYHQEESLPGDSQPVSAGGFTQENKSFSSAIQNDFQGSGNFDGSAGGFANKQGGSYQRVGGARDMGGNRGRGGVSNGYRGNQQGRGGPSGNYRGRGGNYANGNPGRGRGGSTYSGYPPRGDYRPDGYQGFSSSFTPGFSGGKPRGSARGTGDGGPRRGPPRGGNGGMNRGGGRGGYAPRPNMQQGQAAAQ